MNQFNGKRVHFIGIGGIGMSGLAQMCRELGAVVSGSDRGVNAPENRAIFHSLRQNGITIYPQDGSFVKHGGVDYIIYSTAIEADNPDFSAAPETARLHRSQALFMAIQSTPCRYSAAI
ncbi:MAG: Mur ligase domain-containing protein, partial [Victivallaceae bacterium]